MMQQAQVPEARGRRPQDPHARFVAKIQETADGCHLWTGTVRDGHPVFALRGPDGAWSTRPATHVAWARCHGPAPRIHLLQSCGKRLCVRVEHLFRASDPVQMRAAAQAHPAVYGWAYANAKLTAEQVCAIRTRYVPGVVTLAMLAREYAVSPATVYQVLTWTTWRGVT